MTDHDLRPQPRLYLREWRRIKGLSQVDLSKLSGVTQGTISFLEQPDHRPAHPSTVRKLADALGLTPEQLHWPPHGPGPGTEGD